jgi:hypothetical protein
MYNSSCIVLHIGALETLNQIQSAEFSEVYISCHLVPIILFAGQFFCQNEKKKIKFKLRIE